MEEILFRGKDHYNIWRFGSLIKYDSGQVGIVTYAKRYGEMEITGEVDTKTVGQYTGRRDKNGDMIFKGDIVCGMRFDGMRFAGVVKYDNASFYIENDTISYYAWMDYEVEIIGNITDDPELIKKINLNTYVYCTYCDSFNIKDIDNPFCQYQNDCDFWSFEDSKPFQERPHYESSIKK